MDKAHPRLDPVLEGSSAGMVDRTRGGDVQSGDEDRRGGGTCEISGSETDTETIIDGAKSIGG